MAMAQLPFRLGVRVVRSPSQLVGRLVLLACFGMAAETQHVHAPQKLVSWQPEPNPCWGKNSSPKRGQVYGASSLRPCAAEVGGKKGFSLVTGRWRWCGKSRPTQKKSRVGGNPLRRSHRAELGGAKEGSVKVDVEIPGSSQGRDDVFRQGTRTPSPLTVAEDRLFLRGSVPEDPVHHERSRQSLAAERTGRERGVLKRSSYRACHDPTRSHGLGEAQRKKVVTTDGRGGFLSERRNRLNRPVPPKRPRRRSDAAFAAGFGPQKDLGPHRISSFHRCPGADATPLSPSPRGARGEDGKEIKAGRRESAGGAPHLHGAENCRGDGGEGIRRIAILVSGRIQKLLMVPKTRGGTGVLTGGGLRPAKEGGLVDKSRDGFDTKSQQKPGQRGARASTKKHSNGICPTCCRPRVE
ncbi:hypothetical protein GWK47_016229 [Chionoecetes opilio]|uniref:Uncharacterized protein n=1 Tax=Chionoecetes opilio TaxID=41210 RepID=A0A8J4XRL2_CHIOP|nr:hypothetical protein GWK47_016229 [Chionoecetes opilio]